ncbi:tensin-2 isoform X2 [Pseudophryne corroboree]|uniref:tensin-2 isoform X2 n=1 Tax=Pseudophryne corroboree TaxID=495146 RepID=UPI003081EEE4
MKPRRTFQEVLRGLSRSFNCATPAGGERHVFHEKVLRKKRLCAACSEPVLSQGSVCRVCKITSHKKCEGKVPPGCSSPPPADMRRRTAPGPSIQHMSSTKSLSFKQRSSLPRSFSLDQVIQRSYDLDLTYITERIISVFFPTSLEEQRYRSNLHEVASMLRSKHEDKYLLFNLSKKRHDIGKLNPKVQDFFWPDCHAPSLDVICSICKAMEAWLNSDPQHVVVLYCKGNQGKTGVVIASYMHYSKVSASVDQALSTLAMRKFCEDKSSSSLHPSQRRYINYFGGLLSGTIKISSDMLSLQCVLLPVIPALQTDGGFCPFLKIYQSMQLVYTSGIYLSLGDGTGQKRQLCISLEPALLLKGDIMVKCYHKRCKPHDREVLFRLQFHTCTIHNTHLCFSKDQLDCANTDDKFPDDAAVEFIFSSGQDKAKGREVFHKDPSISVDYDITDPLVRYDSYENLNVNHEDSLEDLRHTRGPVDGSLYARVNKKSTPLASTNGSPEQHGRLLSVSSDSGHSSAPTERLEETPQKALPTAAEQEDLNKLLGGFGVNVKQEGEPQYSQVLKHEQAVTQNGHQRQKMDERPQDLQHRDHPDGINQNIQAKMAREARLQYSPQWSGVSDEGTSQSLPLTSASWEEQRESSGGTHWDGQRDHEAAILEEEMGQFGGLAMYPGRRPLLSRHCSCRLGYAGPNIEGPPNRSYFRGEGFLDPRGEPGAGAVLQGGHYPALYGDQDRRRLYRSLSEGPQHYPNQTQSPPKRGSLRENRQYICQPPRHEHVFPPMCPCSHCQSTACYPVPNMWSLEGGKIPPMQPFHRGELPSHLSQPYGQSSQHNHDIAPPFQVPLDKMHYGFSIPHGEDSLHFTHFPDAGYGHIYPHFLHPSYLPTKCPPNGYGAHALSTCMPSYNQAGGQSPPSSVSPIVTTSCAPRRVSGDNMSAGSTGELTPPQQQDFPDHGVHRNALSSQLPKPPAAAPATSLSAVTHPNSVVHARNPLHTSTPANDHHSGHTYTNPLTHGNNTVQSGDFVHPQSPVHTSTPINTYYQLSQTQQNPIHTQNAAVQTQCSILRHSGSSPPHRQLSQADHATQPQNPSVQQKLSPPRAHVHFHSQVHTQPPVAQANGFVQKNIPPVQSQNSEQIQNTPTPVAHNSRMTQEQIHNTQTPVAHNSRMTQEQIQNTPTPVAHNSRMTQEQIQNTPTPVAHNSRMTQEQIQNTPTPVAHNSRMTQEQSVYTNSIVRTQGFTHPLSPPTSTGQALGPSPHASLQSQSPATQTSSVVQTHSPSSHPYSPVTSHSPAVQASTAVPSHSALTQTNIPKQTSVHLHSPACTDTPCIQANNTVHAQSPFVHSDSTMQVHSTVRTQMPSLALHSPVHKQSPQTHSTVHIQTASLQTFRNPYNQSPSVPNYRPVYAHNSAQPSSPPSTDRPGVTVSNVASTASEGNSITLHSSSPPHVSKVAPQMPVSPTTRTAEQVSRQQSIKAVSAPNETSTSAAAQYSIPPGTSYPQQPAPISNPVTPQRRSITISLTETPITSHGMEVPTTPPLSPMGSQCELQSPSPTPLFPISTAYYSGSPCPPNAQPPMLPEKLHTPATGDKSGTLGRSNELQEDKSPSSTKDVQQDSPPVCNFVQDSSKFWYRPNITREQAIALLRGAEPGSFLIRDSNSFRGAYGLALKVSSPPPNVQAQPCRDPAEQLVRHFLIETGPKGVKIKGSPIEPHFGSLSALVSQHSVTPLSLPCRLRVPDKDLTEQNLDVAVPTNMSTAADLLRQGAACCVLYLGSVDTESLTGPQAISKASSAILTPPRSTATTVHFKVSDQGITLTDSQRKLFFRRHYSGSSVTFCSADPQDRRWTNPDRTTSKVFGFVARKASTTAENVCHLFAELDPEQPASAIVNFITKVMLGTHRR